MAYEPYEWKDGNAGGTPITADRLNHLENGVDEAHDIATSASSSAAGKAPLARGLPSGGTAGQLLVKSSSADYATGWQSPSTTVASHTHPQSQVDNLSSDLNAIRAAAFGGPSRTRPPQAYMYLNADTAYGAGANILWSGRFTKYTDPDNMLYTGGGTAATASSVTIPVDGLYLVELHMISTAASGSLYGRVLLNADPTATTTAQVGAYTVMNQGAVATPEATFLHLAIPRPFLAGDKLTFTLYGTVGGTMKAGWFGGTEQTFMGARYIGPVIYP